MASVGTIEDDGMKKTCDDERAQQQRATTSATSGTSSASSPPTLRRRVLVDVGIGPCRPSGQAFASRFSRMRAFFPARSRW
jgi:hypothetical protein